MRTFFVIVCNTVGATFRMGNHRPVECRTQRTALINLHLVIPFSVRRRSVGTGSIHAAFKARYRPPQGSYSKRFALVLLRRNLH